MSANLRLRSCHRTGTASAGALVSLGLGLALALGGCAMGEDQQPGEGTAMSPAGSCQEQHEEAVQECQLSWDSESNQDQLQACMAQADAAFEACRTQ